MDAIANTRDQTYIVLKGHKRNSHNKHELKAKTKNPTPPSTRHKV